MMIFKQNVRIMSCYFLTFKFLLKTYFKLIGLFRFWNLALCNYLVALEAVRSILKLISNPDLSRPGQGTDLNFQNKIDFLKVLNFSFPVPIVGPCMTDVYHLQRAKIYRRNFPPVGFIQSRTVLLMRRQSNPITPHVDWNYDSWFGLVLTYFDCSRRHTHATTHATGTQIVRDKMTSLDAIFCRGNKSSSRSLARFCRRKHKKPIARASCSWKNLSSTCRQV